MELPFLRSTPVALSDAELQHAESIGCAALFDSGRITLGHFRQGIGVENKDDDGFDPVTVADRDCETLIRERFAQALPEHGVFGEEAGYTPGASGLTWVVDPIDGTRSYICGVPLWGTLAGLSDGRRPVLGLMYQPFTDEMYVGSRLGGRLMRGGESQALQCSHVRKLCDARLFCTSLDIFDATQLAQYSRAAEQAKLVRTGTDCYAYCLLAAGHADLVIEAGLQCYDIYALIPIIESAGGVVTDWHGGDPSRGGTVVAAATPDLHAETLEALHANRA